MKFKALFKKHSLSQLVTITGLSMMTLWRIKQGGKVSKRSRERLKKV